MARDRLKGLTIEFLTYDCEVAHRSNRKNAGGGRQASSSMHSPGPEEHPQTGHYTAQDKSYLAHSLPGASIHQHNAPYGDFSRVDRMPALDQYPPPGRQRAGHDGVVVGEAFPYNKPRGDTYSPQYPRHGGGSAIRYDMDADARPLHYNAPSYHQDQRQPQFGEQVASGGRYLTGQTYQANNLAPHYFPQNARSEASYPGRPEQHYNSNVRSEPPYHTSIRQGGAAFHASPPQPPALRPDNGHFSFARPVPPERLPSMYNSGDSGSQGSMLLDRSFTRPPPSTQHVTGLMGLVSGFRDNDSYFTCQLPSYRGAEYKHFSEPSTSIWGAEAVKPLHTGNLQGVSDNLAQLLMQPPRTGPTDRLGDNNASLNDFPPPILDFEDLFRADT